LSSDNPETVNQILMIIRSGASEQEIFAALSADDSSSVSTNTASVNNRTPPFLHN